ncbi:MAG: 30S ribosomal protein S12 methylthiotransferase RimO [Anaerotardibacter sp.]
MLGRVSFVTLGCAKNEVDSEHMKRKLAHAGFHIVANDEPCDVVVVNTCSFIQSAIEESLDVIFDIAQESAHIDGTMKLVVTGCLPSRYGDSLAEELTEPDKFVTCAEEDTIVEAVCELLDLEPCSFINVQGGNNSSASEAGLPNGETGAAEAGTATGESSADQAKINSADSDEAWLSEIITDTSAYLKISDGCSRFCSYCTIPFIRGRYHSFPREEVLKEAHTLIATGAKEVVLIAQDSGLWGTDFAEPDTLASLLDELASTYPEIWFRVMYLQPEGLTDELLSTFKAHDNICNYFDIPLQHCNEELLKTMNRTGSDVEFLETIAKIREVLPDVTLRTTLIVGYPGETDEQFEQLCDFVSEAEFDYVGIFPYSQEEGTKAAKMPNQIEEEIKNERLQELRDLADAISTQKTATHIGSEVEVLVLGEEEDGQLYGRSQSQAPDVDGVIYLDEGVVGEFGTYKIDDTLLYVMEASRV